MTTSHSLTGGSKLRMLYGDTTYEPLCAVNAGKGIINDYIAVPCGAYTFKIDIVLCEKMIKNTAIKPSQISLPITATLNERSYQYGACENGHMTHSFLFCDDHSLCKATAPLSECTTIHKDFDTGKMIQYSFRDRLAVLKYCLSMSNCYKYN